MSINVSITNSRLENRMNKAITKMPESMKPRPFSMATAKNRFTEQALDYYIDALLRDKIISN